MYQGKFDAKSRGQQAPRDNLKTILEERNAAKASVKQPQVVRQPLPKQQAQAIKKPQPVVQPTKAQPVRQYEPAPKRGPRLGSVIFYTVYFLCIFLFFGGVFMTLQWLNGWLMDYEAAQPTVKCQEVFDSLFKDPDWAQLYVEAEVEDTEFEGADQYVAYMKEKVGDKELDFVETSAGLSGDKKYIVRLDGEKIATFTLEGKSESITDIPDWKEGKIELFFQREKSCLIQKLDGHTAYVNGVELSDDNTIQVASTKGEKYLPVGTVGVRVCTQKVDDLLCMPEVTITNQKGEQMEVVYDEQTNTFAEQTVSAVIPEEAKTVTLGALKAYAEFMINAAGSGNAVEKYYDSNSQTYSDIRKMAGELWMNHDYGHSFKDETVSNYCRYSDDLFSVHGAITMVVTCKDGSVKEYGVDQSLFFRKKNGNWVCYEMTNEDVSQPVGKVRLTFMNDGVVLSSEFYDTDAQQIQTPVVSVPEGKVFSGWVREDRTADGRTELTVVFTPDESGLVTLGNGSVLQPMTLYALFENASAEGGEQS